MITELSRWRAASGLTQLEAARALGVSQAYFSLLERGARPMTDGLRRRLSAVRAERLREQPGSAGGRHSEATEDVTGLNLSEAREHAHALLDSLAPKKLIAVRLLLDAILDSPED